MREGGPVRAPSTRQPVGTAEDADPRWWRQRWWWGGGGSPASRGRRPGAPADYNIHRERGAAAAWGLRWGEGGWGVPLLHGVRLSVCPSVPARLDACTHGCCPVSLQTSLLQIVCLCLSADFPAAKACLQTLLRQILPGRLSPAAFVQPGTIP